MDAEKTKDQVQRDIADLKKYDSMSVTFVIKNKLMHITYVCLDDEVSKIIKEY